MGRPGTCACRKRLARVDLCEVLLQPSRHVIVICISVCKTSRPSQRRNIGINLIICPLGLKQLARWYTPIQNVTNPTRLPNNAHKKTERWHTPTPESFKPTQRHSAVQSKHIETIGVTKQPRTSSRHSSNDPNIPTPLHYFIKQTHVTKTTYLHEPASGESNTLAPLQQTSIHNVIHPTPLRKPIQKSLPTQTAVAPNSINEKKRQSDLEDYTGGNNNNKKLRRDTTIIFRND